MDRGINYLFISPRVVLHVLASVVVGGASNVAGTLNQDPGPPTGEQLKVMDGLNLVL